MQQNEKESVLTLENRKRISLSGVTSVDGFSETNILLTVNGARVKIAGSHLKVLAFSQGTGNFSACGDVDSVVYGANRGSFLRRLLK